MIKKILRRAARDYWMQCHDGGGWPAVVIGYMYVARPRGELDFRYAYIYGMNDER